jgi:hypothetical protein
MAGADEFVSIRIDAVRAHTPAERELLLDLQRRAIQYFLDNQVECGLILDRQRNRGPERLRGLCSSSSTGMGLIALALASAPPHRLIAQPEAEARIRAALLAALEWVPHDRGILPHFIDSHTGSAVGADPASTVDTSWIVAGALWAAALLRNREIEQLALRLYHRVDWHYWTAPEQAGNDGLIRHGKGCDGQFLKDRWDRLNGETVFMYVLAAGADEGRGVPPSCWGVLRPFYGTVAGRRFNNADLGLFVFQYGLDLLDLKCWEPPGEVDLMREAGDATAANYFACRAASGQFQTYGRYWGLSAGDGPGETAAFDRYRDYSPGGPLDGTACLTASLGSVAHQPEMVLENILEARSARSLDPWGRYGLSNVNVDQAWVARDIVGIDLGAAILAIDNYLNDDRVRATFHEVPCIAQGLERLGFVKRWAERRAS